MKERVGFSFRHYPSVLWETHKKYTFLVLLIIALVMTFCEAQGFDPLKHPILITIVGLIGGAITAAVILAVNSVKARITEDLIYFAAEIANEAGPSVADLDEAARVFTGLFNYYEEMVRRRSARISYHFLIYRMVRLGDLLGVIRTRLNPRIPHTLESFSQVTNAIAAYCESFREKYGGAVFNAASIWVSRNHSCASDANSAIGEFHEVLMKYRFNPSIRLAKQTCLASRRAGAIVHCVWIEYLEAVNGDLGTINQFEENLSLAVQLTRDSAATRGASETKLLLKYADSLERRLEAVKTLRSGDRKLLWEMLSKAAHQTYRC